MTIAHRSLAILDALRQLTRGVALIVAGLGPATAGTTEADVVRQVRAVTFEVVVRKFEPPGVRYAKALPTELVPFAERNDPYWSIGTALAIAPGQFASAGHVLGSTVGAPFGRPALRDRAGRVYAVDRILKYSQAEDFVVFTVRDGPDVQPLPIVGEYALDGRVYAAGNALGEGIVVRDGLLTSETPEAVGGRWNWLRFSAAASPGNSGGPLLDTEGRLIGLVIGRSPNENLNYALPIQRLTDDPGITARIELFRTVRVPVLDQAVTLNERGEFALPLDYDEFARQLMATSLDLARRRLAELQKSSAASWYPRGTWSSELVSKTVACSNPTLYAQDDSGRWTRSTVSAVSEAQLDGDDRISITEARGMMLFRMQIAEPARANDSAWFMDRLLEGLKLPRMVGAEAIRITGLGPATRTETHVDAEGRSWTLQTWPLGFMDLTLVVSNLRTPDGRVGMLSLVPGQAVDGTIVDLRLLTDFLCASYTGSLAQWQQFLRAPVLLPPALAGLDVKLDAEHGLELRGTQLSATLPSDLMPRPDSARLTMHLQHAPGQERPTPGLAVLSVAAQDDEITRFDIVRHLAPGEDATAEHRRRWDSMTDRSNDFSGRPNHDDAYSRYWFRTAVGEATSGYMYEVFFRTARALLPRQLEQARDRILESIRMPRPEGVRHERSVSP